MKYIVVFESVTGVKQVEEIETGQGAFVACQTMMQHFDAPIDDARRISVYPKPEETERLHDPVIEELEKYNQTITDELLTKGISEARRRVLRNRLKQSESVLSQYIEINYGLSDL